MLPARLLPNRRGTATIEFALVLPIMVLLVLGLADGVRRNLAMIDVDAAVQDGAAAALRYGFDRGGISRAMARPAGNIRADSIKFVECVAGKSRKNGESDDRKHPGKAKAKQKGRRPAAGAADARCGGRRAGRYVEITASTRIGSPYGATLAPVIAATASVRLR